MYVFENGQWNDHNRIKIVKREPKHYINMTEKLASSERPKKIKRVGLNWKKIFGILCLVWGIHEIPLVGEEVKQ